MEIEIEYNYNSNITFQPGCVVPILSIEEGISSSFGEIWEKDTCIKYLHRIEIKGYTGKNKFSAKNTNFIYLLLIILIFKSMV